MKIWTKIRIKEENKNINIMAASLTNYILEDNPLINLYNKYNVNNKDKEEIKTHITNRMAGLLILYFSKDKNRINDLINKYNRNDIKEVIPEIEGYKEK